MRAVALNEEKTLNNMKREQLIKMQAALRTLMEEADALYILDRDGEGAFDLNDQLSTMFRLGTEYKEVIARANSVIPKV
jgi:hypothetical protein